MSLTLVTLCATSPHVSSFICCQVLERATNTLACTSYSSENCLRGDRCSFHCTETDILKVSTDISMTNSNTPRHSFSSPLALCRVMLLGMFSLLAAQQERAVSLCPVHTHLCLPDPPVPRQRHRCPFGSWPWPRFLPVLS